MDVRDGSAVDVIIFGAGPAGSATALALLGMGYTVLIVERMARIPTRGEGLPGAARAELAALGLWEGFLAQEHVSVWSMQSAWGAGVLVSQDLSFHPYGQNWHLDRAAFDTLCRDRAVACGASLMRGQITEIARHDERWWTVGVRGGTTQIVTSRFAVDATGRAAAFARRQGERRVRYDRLVGISAMFKDIRSPQAMPFTLVEAAPQGWWYVGRLPRGLATAVYMTDADQVPSGSARVGALWNTEWARTAYVQSATGMVGAPVVRVWSAETSALRNVFGVGWVAVGDAACAFDPLSSLGICNALESGRWAADAIARTLHQDDTCALKMYGARMKQRFEEFNRLRLAYYRAERRWPRSMFWERRHLWRLPESTH